MDYVFGTNGQVETLKTKGDTHTDLTGFQQVTQTYPDQTITDCFRVVNKYNASEDVEGNCYDWYIIDSHYRMVDKSKPIADEATRNAANIDYLSMMSDIDLPETKEATTNE